MKKGFTLIELLAVIVILAIIAVIAVPIVLNIINDSKESAVIRSAEFYLDGLEKSVATSIIKNIEILDGTYNILETGNICLKYENNACKEMLEINIDGEVPSSGTITIEKGQVTTVTLVLNDKVIKKNDKNELVFVTTLANYIKRLYKETKTTTVNNIEYSLDETHSLMNDRMGSKDVPKTDGNIRYYGANPNNYIDIGDRDSEGNIIFWRIIGLFKDIEVTDENDNVIKKEDLVKIIRADRLAVGDSDGFAWDCKYDGTTMSYSNVWSTSTLNTMLNKAYYDSKTIDYWFRYSLSQPPAPRFYDFKNIGLSSKKHNKIARVKWNLGGHNSADVYANNMYGYERSGENTWSGKIALMYPSDYGYSADISECQVILSSYLETACTTTNWMYDSTRYQWTLTPYSYDNHQAFYATTKGIIDYNSQVSTTYGVRPVMYLNSNISIIEEKETNEGLKYLVVE